LVQTRQLVARALWLAFGLFFLISVPAFSQEPEARKHRHTRKVTKGVTTEPPYVANAVDFDGTSDFMERGGLLTGQADGKLGTISFWVRIDGGDGSQDRVFNTTNDRFSARILSANTIRVTSKSTGDSTVMRVTSGATYLASSAWIHVLASWDMNTPEAYLFINDADDEGVSTENDDTIDYTDVDNAVGADVGGNGKWVGCISELYINQAEFIDITVEANRRRFIDAAGKPVSLGSDGSLPTGTAPIMYLNGDSTNFQTNQGTGGNFTVTGALDDCSTSPTD